MENEEQKDKQKKGKERRKKDKAEKKKVRTVKAQKSPSISPVGIARRLLGEVAPAYRDDNAEAFAKVLSSALNDLISELENPIPNANVLGRMRNSLNQALTYNTPDILVIITQLAVAVAQFAGFIQGGDWITTLGQAHSSLLKSGANPSSSQALARIARDMLSFRRQ